MPDPKQPECTCHTAEAHEHGERMVTCMGQMMQAANDAHLSNEDVLGIAACLAAIAADGLGGRAQNVMRLVSMMMEAPSMHSDDDDEPTQGGADA